MSSAAALLLSACAPTPYVCAYTVNGGERCAQELANGDLDRAETYCDLGLEFSPRNPDLWAKKGFIALERQDTAKAKQHSLQALEYDPGNRQALLNLGYAHLQEGAYESARERFSQALKVAPAFVGARYGLGLALLKLGRREEARKELTAVLDAAPGDTSTHRILAKLDFKEQNLEGAWQHQSRLTQLAPEEPLYWRDLGAVLLHQRRFGEAEAAFLQCLRLPEPYADCQDGLEKARRSR